MIRTFLLTVCCLLFAAHCFAATATDDFNRTDAADLGATWTIYNTDWGSLRIESNMADAITGQGDDYRNDISPGGDQFSQFTIGAFTGSAVAYLMAAIRIATAGSNPNRYRCMAARNDPYYGGKTSIISVISGGSETVISSEAATTWVSTDTLRCRAIGGTIYLDRNGSNLLNIPDATLATGNVGLEIYTEDVIQQAAFDAWTGGDNPSVSAVRHGVR